MTKQHRALKVILGNQAAIMDCLAKLALEIHHGGVFTANEMARRASDTRALKDELFPEK